jgi:hypothetical protein
VLPSAFRKTRKGRNVRAGNVFVRMPLTSPAPSTASTIASRNGQVERMNRTIKDAIVRRFYATHASLRAHLATFLDAYNFAKRLESLRGLTPFERICQLWTDQPKDSD